MRPSQFKRLLDIHGGDLTAWPEKHALAAHHLVIRSAQARQHLNSFVLFENTIEDSWQFPSDAAMTSNRIIASAMSRIDTLERRPEKVILLHAPLMPFWAKAGAWSIIALALFITGASFGVVSSGNTAYSDKAIIQTLIIDGPYRSYASL